MLVGTLTAVECTKSTFNFTCAQLCLFPTQMEDFDDGVLYQLGQKRSEEEAIGALRVLGESNLAHMQVGRGADCMLHTVNGFGFVHVVRMYSGGA